jgi:hypothetical protein
MVFDYYFCYKKNTNKINLNSPIEKDQNHDDCSVNISLFKSLCKNHWKKNLD